MKITKEQLIHFEDRVAELFRQGKIRTPIHLSGGNEEQLIKYFKAFVGPQDYIFSTHRSHYHYLLKTGDFKGLLDEIRQKSGGPGRGQGGSMHVTNHKQRFYASSIVGGLSPVALGVAIHIKKTGGMERVHCFLGDAAFDSGLVWSCIHYAERNDLPITYICEDNDRSVEANKKDRLNLFPSVYNFVEPPLTGHLHTYYYSYKPTRPHVGIGEWVEF